MSASARARVQAGRLAGALGCCYCWAQQALGRAQCFGPVWRCNNLKIYLFSIYLKWYLIDWGIDIEIDITIHILASPQSMQLWGVPAHELRVWRVGTHAPYVAPSLSCHRMHVLVAYCIASSSPPTPLFVWQCKQSLKLEFVAIANSKFLSHVLHSTAMEDNIDL